MERDVTRPGKATGHCCTLELALLFIAATNFSTEIGEGTFCPTLKAKVIQKVLLLALCLCSVQTNEVLAQLSPSGLLQ